MELQTLIQLQTLMLLLFASLRLFSVFSDTASAGLHLPIHAAAPKLNCVFFFFFFLYHPLQTLHL
jgi:hypothetical protein